MGVQVISIPTEVVSHSLPFPILCFILIPMGFRWDSRSHYESHSHAHLYPVGNDSVGIWQRCLVPRKLESADGVCIPEKSVMIC